MYTLVLHLARSCVIEILAHPAVILVCQHRSQAQLKAVSTRQYRGQGLSGKEADAGQKGPEGYLHDRLPARSLCCKLTTTTTDCDSCLPTWQGANPKLLVCRLSVETTLSLTQPGREEPSLLPGIACHPNPCKGCTLLREARQQLRSLRLTCCSMLVPLTQSSHCCLWDARCPPLGRLPSTGCRATSAARRSLSFQRRVWRTNSPPAPDGTPIPSQGAKSGEPRTVAGQSQQPAVELVRQSAVRCLLCVLQPCCV